MSDLVAPPADSDPVLTAVIANRVQAIAEHMAEAMLLTSRSPIFQLRDMVTGIFTAAGRWVSTKDWIPVLAGSMPTAWKSITDWYGSDVHDGDVFLLNDPHHGNNHPPDMTIMKPVFHEGELAFWAVSKGHHIDVGGGGVVGFNPYAEDCWEDALRIPPVRLYRAGEYQRDVWELILMNVRAREFSDGDLHCQVGAVNVGADDLRAMLTKFGRAPVDAALERHLEADERNMRAEISKLRDGVYRAERYVENGSPVHPSPVRIQVEVRIDGDRITVDYTGSDPQVPGWANSPYANTVAGSYIGVFGIINPNFSMNSGSVAPIEVIAVPGSVVNPLPPAATTLATLALCDAIVESIWLALADAVPSGSNAGWSSGCYLAQVGVDAASGVPFASSGSFGFGGSGGTLGADGWDGLGSAVAMGGTQAPDVEVAEFSSPITVLGFGIVEDSGGAGQWRGGHGVWSKYRIEQDGVRCLRYGGGGSDRTSPFGLHGGMAADPHYAEVRRADGAVEPATVNTIMELNAGDVLYSRDGGGGGYGNPHDRDPQAVVDDVRSGLVTTEAAERDYGFVIDTQSWTVDAARTAQLRTRVQR